MTPGRMHTRRSTPKGRGGSSGGGNPRNDGRITEEQHEDAMRVLRAEYYQGVRGIAQELGERVKSGDIKSQDDWDSAIHQAVDGSYWVIYTHANFQVLLCSDNHDAYSEEYGQPAVQGDSIDWAALAFATLQRDVHQQIAAEGIEPDWSNLEEAPRRRPPRDDVSDQQIRALRNEAGQAGDLETAALCDRALRGDARARRRCANIISDAQAQIEESPRRRAPRPGIPAPRPGARARRRR